MNVYEVNISTRQRVLFLAQALFHLLLTVFVVSAVWLMAYNREWNTLHTWHVFLCTVGFALLMAEGIAALNQDNLYLIGVDRPARTSLHSTLSALSAIAIIIGVSIKIKDKANNQRSHFTTAHGICGFITFLLTILALLGGPVIGAATKLYKDYHIKPVYVKGSHAVLGITAYVLGIATLALGIYDYFNEATTQTKKGLIVILVLSVALNLGQPIRRLLRV